MKHAKLYSDRRQSLGTSLFAFTIPHCRRGGGEGGGFRQRERERHRQTDIQTDTDRGNQREREREGMEDSVKNIQEYTNIYISMSL